jgi:hypothetical protein
MVEGLFIFGSVGYTSGLVLNLHQDGVGRACNEHAKHDGVETHPYDLFMAIGHHFL